MAYNTTTVPPKNMAGIKIAKSEVATSHSTHIYEDSSTSTKYSGKQQN